MQKRTKTNTFTSSSTTERAIMRKSVAGIQFVLDEDDLYDEEDLGYAAKMSKTVTDIAGSLACQINQIICPKISFQEKVSYVRSDPMLWNEFLQELKDSKIVTNFGVKEILARFIAERDDKIVDAYKCSLKAAAQKPLTSKEDKTPKADIGSVIQRAVCSSSALSGMAAAASSVKRSIQRRTSISFELKRPSSDQKQNTSESCRRHSYEPRKTSFDLGDSSSTAMEQEPSSSTLSGMAAAASSLKQSVKRRTSMPLNFSPKHSSTHQLHDSHSTRPVSEITRKVTFDLSEPSSKTAKQTLREPSEISVGNFRRNASISAKTSSLSAVPRFSENRPRTVIENSSSPCNAESSFNGEPSPHSTRTSSLSAAPRFSKIRPRTVVENSSSPCNAEWSFNGEPSPHKYNDNVAKMDLIVKRTATSTSPSTSVRCNAERKCPNSRSELEIWRNKSKSVVKTEEEKDVQVGYSCSTETSLPEKLTKMDMSSSKKLDVKASIPFQNKNQRAYYNTQFHIKQDANPLKRIAHSTPCMWKTTDTVGFMEKGKNNSSFAACFELSHPKTPVELLTMYLD